MTNTGGSFLHRSTLKRLRQHSLWVSCIFGGVMAFSVLAANAKKPDYAATGRLRFTRNTPTASVTEAGQQVGRFEALLDENSPLETEIEIIQSTSVITAVIQALELEDAEGDPLSPKDFLDQLKVRSVGSSDLLAVTYVSQDAEEAARVVNYALQEYLQQSVRARRQQATAAREFVEQQLTQAQQQVEQAEKALIEFRQRNDNTAASQDPEAAISRFTALQQQVQNTQTELMNVQGQLQILRSQFSLQADSTVSQLAVGQSPTLQAAQNELEELERELGRQKVRYRDETPIIQTLEDEVEALKKIVEQRRSATIAAPSAGLDSSVNISAFHQSLAQQIVALESEQAGLANELESLKILEQQGQQTIKQLPQLQEEQRSLAESLRIAQETVSNLLKNVSELRIAEAQSVGNAEILERAAVPQKPTSSKVPLYAAGFLLSSLLSGLWIYRAESRYLAQKEFFLTTVVSPGDSPGDFPSHSEEKSSLDSRKFRENIV